jgi:hypothetical protein
MVDYPHGKGGTADGLLEECIAGVLSWLGGELPTQQLQGEKSGHPFANQTRPSNLDRYRVPVFLLHVPRPGVGGSTNCRPNTSRGPRQDAYDSVHPA